MKSVLLLVFLPFLFSIATPVLGQERCTDWKAKLVSAQGRVESQLAGNAAWLAVQLNETFCSGDQLRTWERSRAVLELTDETFVTLGEKAGIVFTGLAKSERSWLDLLKGAVYIRSRVPQTLKINTPFVNAVIKGTEFLVDVQDEQTQIIVYEGTVVADNTAGELTLTRGQTGVAKRGQAPARQLLIDPDEAVQWALYYPPVIDYRDYPIGVGHPAIESAISDFRRGDLTSAFAALDGVPQAQRNARFYNLRAGLLLSVGRVDQAQPDIESALRLDSKNATAVALKSVIALAQNRKKQALDLAQKAVELGPKSPVPYIALSYAQQALFDIEKSLKNVKQAVELAPNDALAWARLAELQLSLGDLDEALDAAQKAVQIDPDLARTQAVLGFAHLTQIDIDDATQAFETAIAFDPAAPLPRLGLGLAKIRQGDVEEGTSDIEIAASLDPNNSLIRSYLGKAFYEQKRGRLAQTEFSIAKELDPRDPTPWFYDAIYKQTVNRPIEALHDMQKAIELNDNRAVFRSRLLLDDDLAARSAAIGRIYNDLGFQRLGLLEGWKSVNTDPSNYSAHRLLADNYSVLPRHEIARVSELLQSQLLQPINITPVQPQLATSNLLILDGLGPADPSFNEFNPLFARNRLALQLSGVVGTNETYGDEVVQSGLWNKFSYSLGQFHTQTDGYRENNGVRHNIYNAFVQGFLSPEVSVQAEYRYNKIDHGDIQLHFDPMDEDPFFRRKLRTNTARVGLRYTPAQHSTFIVSGIFQNEKEDQRLTESSDADFDSQGYIVEGQYLFRIPDLSVVFGGGYFQQKEKTVIPIFDLDSEFDIGHANGYLYSQVRFPSRFNWTFGLSYDELSDPEIGNISKVNPKLGLLVNVTPDTTIRLAAFRTLKRSLLTDQTIEPTQVAGFNQFFDDLRGTISKRYGAAIDQKFTPDLYAGIQYSQRDLQVPNVLPGDLEKWNEELLRTYIYWTMTPNVAFSVDYSYERFKREDFGFISDFFPTTATHIVPVTFNFFHPSGFVGLLRGTYVHQKVDFFSKPSGSDDFYLVDVGVGYRLPKRYGIISLAVKNLFNQDFRFQGDGLRTTNHDLPLFLPERSVVGQITLNF